MSAPFLKWPGGKRRCLRQGSADPAEKRVRWINEARSEVHAIERGNRLHQVAVRGLSHRCHPRPAVHQRKRKARMRRGSPCAQLLRRADLAGSLMSPAFCVRVLPISRPSLVDQASGCRARVLVCAGFFVRHPRRDGGADRVGGPAGFSAPGRSTRLMLNPRRTW
jgi:hypothetical protein